jgi:exopolysaccharide production protein ExoQ
VTAIYLIVTLTFIAALIRQDQKEWPQFSLALWIPLIWLLASTTRLIPIWFPNANFSAGPGVPSIERSLEGNPISRLIFLILILAAGIVLVRRRNALAGFVRANWGIYILYAYMLLSVVWSIYPEVSIKRYIKMCGCLMMALLVASEEEPHRALEHVFRRYVAVCLALSLFYVKTDRSIGYMISVHGDHFMAGIANHKNDLGILGVYALIFLFIRALRKWPAVDYLDTALILVNIYFLSRARSTTALVLAFLGVGLILGLKAAGSFRRVVIMVLVLLAVALPILVITMNSPGSVVSGAFFSSTGKDATLTGRIPLWKDLIRFGRKDIVFGSGYESYWPRYYKEIWAKWTFLPISAHNGYVEVLLNLGLLGLAIVIGVISKALALLSTEASLSRPSGQWHLAILILFIISNLTEAWLIVMSLGWNLFLMALMTSERELRLRTPSPAASFP